MLDADPARTPRLFDEALSHCDAGNVLNALMVGVVMLDSQLFLTYANATALRLLTISPAQAKGRPFLSLFREEPSLEESLNVAMASGVRRSIESVQLHTEYYFGREEPTERLSVEIRPIDGFTTGIHLLLQIARSGELCAARRPERLVAGRDTSHGNWGSCRCCL